MRETAEHLNEIQTGVEEIDAHIREFLVGKCRTNGRTFCGSCNWPIVKQFASFYACRMSIIGYPVRQAQLKRTRERTGCGTRNNQNNTHRGKDPRNMNLRLQNQLNMVGACITMAQSSDYRSVWNGKEPADFGTDLAQLQGDYASVTAKAAQADAATGGAADAKAVAESTLEDAAYVLARALANHFKKTGDLDRHGKVDLTKSEIVKLRTQELVNRTTAIRDLGATTTSEPNADKRGVTGARVTALDAAITNFTKVMSTPRGQIVNRGALLREVETDVAALLEKVSDLDDLVVQFDGGESGKRFIEAWKRARIIVDSGGGQSGGTPTVATAPSPPPAQ